MEPIENLGQRICIIGLSAGGKSTLAQALGRKLNLDVFYLDQMAHIPHTNWEEQDESIFMNAYHNILTNYDNWIIEGNYSKLMPIRFEQATTIIWLDYNKWGSVYRYIKRTLKNDPHRPGKLEGSEDRLNFHHIYYTLFKAPKNRKVYQRLIDHSNAQFIRITSFNELMNYYKFWKLYDL